MSVLFVRKLRYFLVSLLRQMIRNIPYHRLDDDPMVSDVKFPKKWTKFSIGPCILGFLIVFLMVPFVLWYFGMGGARGRKVENFLHSDAQNRLTYEQAMSELRLEIRERNEIIQELRTFLKLPRYKDQYQYNYPKRPETSHVDCGRVLNGDTKYTESVGGEKNRIKLLETPNLNMTCPAIMERVLPSSVSLKPLKRGVAFARIVYTDYEMVEKQVSMSYHPQNTFCFAIDRKAPPEFHERLSAMAECLPNVLLLPDEESVDSAGHNINVAHYNCMRALLNKPGWGYVLLLQNHDVITKSVYEMEHIYEWLGGANDIELTPEAGRFDALNSEFKWDPRSLKMFRNETGIDEKILSKPMKFAKGAAQGSLSREAVDWMVRTADLSTYIAQWNSGPAGVDEQFIQSFQVSSYLGMPGHFTDECLKQGEETDFVSRMSQWRDPEECATRTSRHSICLLGIEDLRTVAQFPNIMFNKMMPSFDYAIVECTAELLYNRTFLGQEDHKLEEEYYKNMVNVLYHKHHHEKDYKLNCTLGYTRWSKRKYPA